MQKKLTYDEEQLEQELKKKNWLDRTKRTRIKQNRTKLNLKLLWLLLKQTRSTESELIKKICIYQL